MRKLFELENNFPEVFSKSESDLRNQVITDIIRKQITQL